MEYLTETMTGTMIRCRQWYQHLACYTETNKTMTMTLTITVTRTWTIFNNNGTTSEKHIEKMVSTMVPTVVPTMVPTMAPTMKYNHISITVTITVTIIPTITEIMIPTVTKTVTIKHKKTETIYETIVPTMVSTTYCDNGTKTYHTVTMTVAIIHYQYVALCRKSDCDNGASAKHVKLRKSSSMLRNKEIKIVPKLTEKIIMVPAIVPTVTMTVTMTETITVTMIPKHNMSDCENDCDNGTKTLHNETITEAKVPTKKLTKKYMSDCDDGTIMLHNKTMVKVHSDYKTMNDTMIPTMTETIVPTMLPAKTMSIVPTMTETELPTIVPATYCDNGTYMKQVRLYQWYHHYLTVKMLPAIILQFAEIKRYVSHPSPEG
ncbi:hypothetical protein DPMN_069898 [Dreissena polymorpha]|uniref:Uncharacterized protein n=1 Tax=Dreissena polymorpha TaxID=45954 RepID=A0A9D4BX37_DREPO|nr:hypothetical protein DPMN_069898 [Dreissena polymorpha]